MRYTFLLVITIGLLGASIFEPQAQEKKTQASPKRKASLGQQSKGRPKTNPPAAKTQTFTFNNTRLTVVRANVKDWQARKVKNADGDYVNELSDAKGSLVGLTLKFEGNDVVSASYAIDYRDPNKSDVALACGTRRINPFKLATEELQTKELIIDTPGGFLQKDGRMGVISMAVREMPMTFFFDLPPDCAGQKLTLFLLFNDKHSFTVDAGTL